MIFGTTDSFVDFEKVSSMTDENLSQTGPSFFGWVCFGTAVIFGASIIWIIADLKQKVTASLETAQTAVTEANQAVATVNANLPEIVTEVKKGTETLSGLAEDVELIKSVAGMHSDQADRGFRSLATYADEIQKVIAEHAADKNAVILIEKVFGSDLRKVEAVEEFLVGLNKEMIVLILPVAKSKQEILYRACHSAPPRRKPFYIQFPEAEPLTLEAFIRQHHKETAALPAYKSN